MTNIFYIDIGRFHNSKFQTKNSSNINLMDTGMNNNNAADITRNFLSLLSTIPRKSSAFHATKKIYKYNMAIKCWKYMEIGERKMKYGKLLQVIFAVGAVSFSGKALAANFWLDRGAVCRESAEASVLRHYFAWKQHVFVENRWNERKKCRESIMKRKLRHLVAEKLFGAIPDKLSKKTSRKEGQKVLNIHPELW